MKKNLGVGPYLFPMPVLMIATYGENDKVDVMNMAWGGICDTDMVSLNITASHKTSKNIKERKAFTLSIATVDTMKESDFFGMASGNNMEDKFERTGMHAIKSERVNAPIITEYPVTLECEVVDDREDIYGHRVLGKIVNVIADESVLDENGKINPKKLNPIMFDQFQNGYYGIGDKVGQAWNSGKEFMNK